MKKDFARAIEDRRTYYGLSKEAVVSNERIKEIVEHAVKHTPSSFNSQSARVLVLLEKEHDKFWNITMEALRKVVPAESFQATEEKINSFAGAYGTVLFYEDQNVVKALQDQFVLYKDNFPVWSQQSSGMLQLVIWVALENEGYGASLQHYTELVEKEVAKEWNVPDNWKLIAQMPFGKPISEPGNKDYAPLEERVKIYK
ncbi:nitroreductase family protein [Lachnospiraceae bacterium MD1]|uniref:Nitroreductase family protein n=1 Tax=Variimorphobacter saccharofermentans TaxID=2755051 RepID=A0A839JYR9_9FIRM|nr:nitroreductase family protein [Variimorphobacter saccharofermentans]MBB2182815.1 nitroreductase family protein [Variimorphobacter saccharofermentans]